jgi:hypothetical protein
VKEEKRQDGWRWLSTGDLKFRIKEGGEESTVWASRSFVDLGYSLAMYDFVDRCRDELGLELKIDRTWRGKTGFKVRAKEVAILVGEIVFFVREWTIELDPEDGQVTESEWYSP